MSEQKIRDAIRRPVEGFCLGKLSRAGCDRLVESILISLRNEGITVAPTLAGNGLGGERAACALIAANSPTRELHYCCGAHSYGEGSGAPQRPCTAYRTTDGEYHDTCGEPCSFVMGKGGSWRTTKYAEITDHE